MVQKCSVRKGVLRNFAKFTGKRLCQRLFFNKVAGLACTFIKKESLAHRCFPVNFVKFLRTPFLQNTSGRMLLILAARTLCMTTSVMYLNVKEYFFFLLLISIYNKRFKYWPCLFVRKIQKFRHYFRIMSIAPWTHFTIFIFLCKYFSIFHSYCCRIIAIIENKGIIWSKRSDLFHATVFLYRLKTSENQFFFRNYWERQKKWLTAKKNNNNKAFLPISNTEIFNIFTAQKQCCSKMSLSIFNLAVIGLNIAPHKNICHWI